MATRTLNVILTGDAKSALKAFGEVDAAAGTTSTSTASKFAKAGALIGTAFAAAGVAAGVALFKIGEDFNDAYNTIRVGTGATGETLEGLKDDFKEVVQAVPTDFGAASSAVADLNTRLGLTGEPLQTMAEQFLELSRITKTDVAGNVADVTRVFGDWSIAAGDQSKVLDELFRASQSTGIGIGELAQKVVQFGAPMRGFGFSFTESAALMAKWEKEGVNAEAVLAGLKVGLGKMLKEGEDPKQVLAGLQADFAATGGTAEDVAKVLDIFGTRAGPDMVAALREGRFSIDELLNTIENGGDTILSAGKDTQTFSDKWQMFKNKVLVGLEPAATAVFDGVGKAMDRLPGIVEDVSDKFNEVWADIHKPVEEAGAKIKEIVTDVVAIVEGLWAQFGDNILNFVRGAWDSIQLIIGGALEFISGLVNTVLAIIQGDWGAAWDGIKQMFSGVWDVILGIVTGAANTIIAILGIAWEIVTQAAGAAWEGIKSAVSAGIEAVVGFVASLPGRIGAFAWQMLAAGASLGGAVIDGIKNGISAAAGFASDIAEGILGAFKSGWNAVAREINDFIPDEVGFGTPFGFVGVDLPDNPIPRFHSGIARVPGAPGSEMLAILQAGERVIPASQNRAGGTIAGPTIVVNVGGSVITERQLVDVVRDGLDEHNRKVGRRR